MNIYLMVKVHNITGLRYLCKTKLDPFKYNGSGKDWVPHLEKYGDGHTTEIIKVCHSKEEFSYWGRYYSRLWNIVDAMDDFGNKIWANRIPETGGGNGGPGWPLGDANPSKRDDVKKKKKAHTLVPGYVHPMNLQINRDKISGVNHQSQKDPSYIEKISGDNHYKKQPGFVDPWNKNNPVNDPISRKKMENTWLEKYGVDNPMKSSVVIAKVAGDNHYARQEGYESKISGDNHYTAKEDYVSVNAGNKHYTKKPGYQIKPTNSNYDHTIYTWFNIQSQEVVISNRREMIKRYNLNAGAVSDVINGKKPTYKNWQIKK